MKPVDHPGNFDGKIFQYDYNMQEIATGNL
jgi:hypothetical protein